MKTGSERIVIFLEKSLVLIGGDLRNVKLAEMLAEDEYTIHTFGLENADSLRDKKNIKHYNTLHEAIEKSNIIVGPTPLSTNNREINMLFSSEKIFLDEFLKEINTGKTLIAGNIKDAYLEQINNNGGKSIDLFKRQELSVLNAISTAEGAISIAINETTRTVHGSNVLIMGFGRVGKVLAKMLDGMGANVYCEARKNVDLAWAKAYGYNPIHLNNLDANLDKFDIIINTIPFMILNADRLDKVKKGCFIIDLASNPGGLDRKAAKQKGIKFDWALSLPGRIAPVTSAEFIKETLYNILIEIQ